MSKLRDNDTKLNILHNIVQQFASLKQQVAISKIVSFIDIYETNILVQH